jgi:uncharacterized protein DUF6977
MAERPIFAPAVANGELVKELQLPLPWHAGFAAVQKAKNVKALHESAARAGYSPILEVSSKSEAKVGRHLSAFHLRVTTSDGEQLPLECVFQGSKVFFQGGPYTDLYRAAEARVAKRDPRLRESGPLIGFTYEGTAFPMEPKTAFYDWLYLNAIYPHRLWLERLYRYAAFSDIEFNPHRSVNCQARSCALFVALMRRGLLDAAMKSPAAFIAILQEHDYRPSGPTLASAGAPPDTRPTA